MEHLSCLDWCVFFFFQAEDGIRDIGVTGVQTCALPICRSGLTFAPEGGSERIRRVINKTVSKEDLVRTVTTAYANGWRQVKLYFMCGLPTETDEDVLEIADLAVEVIRAGREASEIGRAHV